MDNYYVIFRNGKMIDYQKTSQTLNANENDIVFELKFETNITTLSLAANGNNVQTIFISNDKRILQRVMKYL